MGTMTNRHPGSLECSHSVIWNYQQCVCSLGSKSKCVSRMKKQTWVQSVQWLRAWTPGSWLLHWRNHTLLGRRWTLHTVPWYGMREKYWQEPTDILKIHELLSVKITLTNKASQRKGPQQTHMNLKWNEDTNWLAIKGVRISVLSSYTAPSRPKQNLGHIVKIQPLPGIHREEDELYVLKKAPTMLRTGTAESTCTPHQLSFKEMGTRRTCVWQYQHNLI